MIADQTVIRVIYIQVSSSLSRHESPAVTRRPGDALYRTAVSTAVLCGLRKATERLGIAEHRVCDSDSRLGTHDDNHDFHGGLRLSQSDPAGVRGGGPEAQAQCDEPPTTGKLKVRVGAWKRFRVTSRTSPAHWTSRVGRPQPERLPGRARGRRPGRSVFKSRVRVDDVSTTGDDVSTTNLNRPGLGSVSESRETA